MHPDLETLVALQEKDVAVADADAALEALAPEQDGLDDGVTQAQRALDAARRGVDDALRRRDELEGKIASYRTMQEQRKQRLEWVRGAKEASTLMAELDLTRSVLAKEEAEFLRSGDAVVAAELKVGETERALAELRGRQEPQREALAARRRDLEALRAAAVTARELVARRLDAALLARYERIRRGNAPRAVYPLHGDACGHCFTAVPTQRRAIIQRGNAIEGCEACGVLLYAAG